LIIGVLEFIFIAEHKLPSFFANLSIDDIAVKMLLP